LSIRDKQRFNYACNNTFEQFRAPDGFFHIVYATIHHPTGKFYYGKHSTKNYYDGYFGSGTLLKHAVNKYGINQFYRKTLGWFNDTKSMMQYEQELLDRAVGLKLCYNISRTASGGNTGNYENRICIITNEQKRKISEANTGRKRPDVSKRLSLSDNGFSDYWVGRTRTAEDKERKSAKAKLNIASGVNPFAQKIQCPHCDKQVDRGNANRWHFNKCKFKKEQ